MKSAFREIMARWPQAENRPLSKAERAIARGLGKPIKPPRAPRPPKNPRDPGDVRLLKPWVRPLKPVIQAANHRKYARTYYLKKCKANLEKETA